MKRIATCCFTGHRPEKMSVPAEIVIRKLKDAIEDAFSDGFIFGYVRHVCCFDRGHK